MVKKRHLVDLEFNLMWFAVAVLPLPQGLMCYVLGDAFLLSVVVKSAYSKECYSLPVSSHQSACSPLTFLFNKVYRFSC